MLRKIVLASIIAGLSSPVIANNETVSQTQFGFTAGLMNGGDDVGGLVYDNGDTVKVSAGGLFAIGAALRTIHSEDFVSKFNAKYEMDNATATNADATFSRFAIDALAGYKLNENITFYGGVTYHLSPEYSEEDDYSSFRASYESSLGLVIEAAYNITNSSELSLRYVRAEYDVESFKIGKTKYDVGNTPTPSVDASSIGIFWSTFF